VRGLLVAGPGKQLICSDYSSIEAVVTAMLSGEQWRIDAFRRKEDIYLHGAAAVTGKTYQWYMENGGKKHPDRQKIGKVSELALGFGGWIGSWRNFDKSDNFTDDQVKSNIVAWREASPMLVELWGGQVRGKPWRPERYELYGLEGMAIAAVQNPGQVFSYRGIEFQVLDDVLFMKLLSGRRLSYHSPRLERQEKFQGVQTLALTFMTYNSNPSMGMMGWVRMETWGSRLCENVVQATARDVMSHAVVKLEHGGYPVVLRVHDEIASEIDDPGQITEEQEQALIGSFESIMADLPAWCKDWPIRAAGGWLKKRYRKD
jgi:DNA polymerase